ncbi:MAG: SMC-Scp complex subunit ScpB [Proteobacteria bacterium]|nr:SMC-Scp complex subunit ScpB [Pseudomonadota bacterium]MBU4275267.1 SMC-Scp complex subunit ScpB [Pseudomonadota bacterium]MBU4382544.1 SMC-Scp complex subunit ScpB [Pseudomonadota bacterium]MCG2765060.1 SMC-Scp complex subunit ScpB [Desulfarculaceae bacterium]
MSRDLKRIIEALLFVSETPLNLAQLCQVLEDNQRDAVKQAIAELEEEYSNSERAMEIVQVAGGWVFRTRKEMAFWLRKLKKQQVTRLSKAALETLSVVAYKQPVLKAEIERIRGVEVGGILRTLMEKNLVRVAGRQDLPGRPLIYSTTRRFLEVFDLKDLSELPTLDELEKLAGIAQDSPADQDGELPLGEPRSLSLDDLIPVEGGLPPLEEAEDGEGEDDEWDAVPEEDGEAAETEAGEPDETQPSPGQEEDSEPEAPQSAETGETPADQLTEQAADAPQEEKSDPEPEPEAEPEPEPGPLPESEPQDAVEAPPKTAPEQD